MSPAKYPDSARLAAYTDAVARRLERVPGVVAASSTTALPSQFPIAFPVAPVGGSDQAGGPGRAEPLDAWYRAVDPHYFSDGPTILVVVVTMTTVVVAATYLPALRASQIDPIVALRQE